MSIKPKVLIMIATDPIGGPGKGLFQFLAHSSRDEFDYVLCNFDVKNRPFGQFIETARRNRLNLVLLRQRATLDPGLITQARRIVLEHDINVIQTHGYKSNVIGMFLRRLCGRPWIGFAHGFTDENWKVRLYNRIDRAALRRADLIVTVAESTKKLLASNGLPEAKIRLIYNAIDPSEIAPKAPAEEVRRRHGLSSSHKVVGVIGRLNPEKGQMVFLRAMATTIRGCPEAKALIIGDGQDRPALERFCRERGLDEHVLFLGYQASVADYYQILDLLVLPSLSEGLPNTVLEAMSFGVPVLATAVGGVPEIIEKDNGVLVPPNDPDALADGMVELLRNDAVRRRIGQAGRSSLYPRFAPDERVRRIVELYNEVLSGRDHWRSSADAR